MSREEFPPIIARKISRLRWTAGLLWLAWLIVGIPFYWAFNNIPRTPEIAQLFTAIITLLCLSPVWFIYMIYRIGDLADHGDES